MTTPTCSAHAAFLAWDPKARWFPTVTETVRVLSGHDDDGDQQMDFIFADGSSLTFVRSKYGTHVFWGVSGMTITEISESPLSTRLGNGHCFAMHERFDREDAPVGYVGVSGAADDTEACLAAQRLYPGYFVGKLVGREAQ